MKTDKEIQMDVERIDTNTINVVCDTLRRYNSDTREYLANIVASVCDVTFEEMMQDTKHLYNAHARWLFWYAYRYMTNESYDSIANKTKEYRKFTEACVGICISKMSMMIEQEPIWKKRWILTKRVIKAILDNGNDGIMDIPNVITLKVTPPKGVDIKLQIDNN